MRMNGWQSTVLLLQLSASISKAHIILVVDFYNHINLLYGSITEFCSPQSCPEMKATDEYVALLYYVSHGADYRRRFEYLWQDSENYKRPTKMPAPTYIEHLMGWVQSNIDNEAVFPSRIGTCNFTSSLALSNQSQVFHSQNPSQA
jgi:hypothetical protein